MFNAYTPSLNAGRFDAHKVYTLNNILKLRNSLATGVVKGVAITIVPGIKVTLDDGIDTLITLIKENATDTGLPKSVDKVPAQTIIDRLELLRGEQGAAVADGNTRSLAILLHYGMTGETIEYPTVDADDTDPRVTSFRANVASAMAIKMEWKARTAFVIDLLAKEPNISEADVMRRTGLGRGVTQQAVASAVAITKHSLDLSKCANLNASQWRGVRDAETVAEAEEMAYGNGARAKAFSPKLEAVKFFSRNGEVGPHAALLKTIIEDDLDGFIAILHASKAQEATA